MRYFRQTLRYLRPYRRHVVLAIVCVVGISVLWGGGLGTMLPGAKILLSAEGLHGWAYRKAAAERLGCGLAWDTAQGMAGSEGEAAALVVASPGTRAAPLRQGDRILRAAGANEKLGRSTSRGAARTLADPQTAGDAALEIQRPDGTRRVVRISLGPMSATTRWLVRLAFWVDEPRTSADRFVLLVWLLVFAGVLSLVRNLLRVVHGFLATWATMGVMLDLRCQAYDHTLRLPVSHFTAEASADTMTRFLQDIRQVAVSQRVLLGPMLIEPAKTAAALAVAAWLSWKLTVLAAVVGPVLFWVIRRLGKAVRRATRGAMANFAGMLAVLREGIDGIRTIKAYTLEARQRRRFRHAGQRLRQDQFTLALLDAVAGPAVEMVGLLAGLGVVALGAYWMLHAAGGIDREALLVVAGCLAAAFTSGRKVGRVATSLHGVDEHARRVLDLLAWPVEHDPAGAVSLGPHQRDICFRDIRVRYGGAEQDALAEVSLTIPCGQTLAVVGPNGSGKTTLASLLPRLIEPSAGQVLVDGHDLAGCSLRSIRRQIALVGQDDVIFEATLAENIAVGRPRATPEEIRRAGRDAFVDEFADDLPQGYDTLLAEKGKTLSAGQRQRVAIARAILRDPRILIFDEALSHVDSESEDRIRRALADFTRGRTTIIIAHRFATVLAADRLIVLDRGHVVGDGTHEQLLADCDVYRRLYQTQWRDSTLPDG